MGKTLAKLKGHLIKPATPSICVGMTAYQTIEQRTFQACFNALGSTGYKFNLITHTSANVWKGRNEIAEHFMATDADYLLFIDADMIFEPQDLVKLVEAIQTTPDAGLVGGFYTSRDELLRPLISWTDDDGFQFGMQEVIERLIESRGKMVEADLIPTGFMIIRREVFEAHPNPWFIVESKQDKKGEWHHFSSDNVFVRKTQEAGFKTYGHFGIELGHIGSYIYHPAQMWPRLEAFTAGRALDEGKTSFIEAYGVNTEAYWSSLYALEKQLGIERQYTVLHKAILAGIQDHWSVLDVGGGTGVLASKVQEVAQTVKCLDLSERAVEYG